MEQLISPDAGEKELYDEKELKRQKRNLFNRAGMSFPVAKIGVDWDTPSKETLKGIILSLIVEGRSLPDICDERQLPILVVLNGLLTHFPDQWTIYRRAHKERVKQEILTQLTERLSVSMADIVDDEGAFLGWDKLSPAAKLAIESFSTQQGKTQIKLTGRNATLTLLGKELGMFQNRKENSELPNLTEVLAAIDKA